MRWTFTRPRVSAGLTYGFFILTMGGLSACSDIASPPPVSATQPVQENDVSLANDLLASPHVEDCAILRISLRGLKASASVEPSPGCAGDILPSIVSTVQREVANGSPMKAISVSLKLNNTTPLNDYGAVMALVVDTAEIAASSPTGFTKGSISKKYSESVIQGPDGWGTTAEKEVAYWLFGDQLNAEVATPQGLLEAGEASGVRILRFNIHAGVHELVVPLRVLASGTLYRGLAVSEVEDSTIRVVAAHKNGTLLAGFSSKRDGVIDGATLRLANGGEITVWAGLDGRPSQVVVGEHIILYENWTDSTVDIAVLAPDGSIHIRKAVSIGGNELEISALDQGLAAVSSTSSYSNAAQAMSLVLSAVACGSSIPTTVTGLGIALFAVACGSFVLEFAAFTSGSTIDGEKMALASFDAFEIALQCGQGLSKCATVISLILLEMGAQHIAKILDEAVRVDEARRALNTSGWKQLEVGLQHVCALRMNGKAYCWGQAPSGQLGTSQNIVARCRSVSEPCSPQPIAVDGGLLFSSISVGTWHTCALTADGKAYCWGDNHYGQLGDGSRVLSSTPKLVSNNLRFRQISAGGLHTCGIATSGGAYCWGEGSYGQLGNGDEANGNIGSVLALTPTLVSAPETFKSIYAGFGENTCALTPVGKAYCWGQGYFGALGIGAFPTAQATPSPVLGDHRFTALSVSTTTCGITYTGLAYCWGSNSHGQLGTTSPVAGSCVDGACTALPIRVTGGHVFRTIETRAQSVCGITTAGRAFCWGRNESGQIGSDARLRVETPTPVAGNHTFALVAPGLASCGIILQGQAYCWGFNGFGQIGNGSWGNETFIPQRVVDPT